MTKGRVYLIGAGPGDPKLMTVRGLECIREADVVVYDRLVNKELLSHAKKSAEIVYVGKAPGNHSIAQSEINRILIDKAGEGKVVARLKGGDPCIFGRGGDEALALAKSGIPFEFVPGVSSAYAVPAYAGIPLTKRGLASSAAVVTGHEVDEGEVNFAALAKLGGTIVFLMGVRNLEKIATKLMDAGLSESTPAVIICDGTLPKQREVTGKLGDIAAKAKAAGITSPAVIVIGKVVALREKLAWFEKKISDGEEGAWP